MSGNCICGRIAVGTIVSDVKNINEKCPLHGYGTEPYKKARAEHGLPTPELITSFNKDDCYLFVEERDIDYSDKIMWYTYGDIKTNDLIVLAKTKNKEIIYKMISPLAHPPMIDRRFGIDRDDLNVAMWMSSYLWALHEKELVEIIENEN